VNVPDWIAQKVAQHAPEASSLVRLHQYGRAHNTAEWEREEAQQRLSAQHFQEACWLMNFPCQFERVGGLLAQALARAPYDPNVHESQAIYLCYRGQVEEAEREFEWAALYGGCAHWPAAYGYYLALARHDLVGLESALEGLNWPLPTAIVALLRGDRSRAQSCIEKVQRQRPNLLTTAYWHWIHGRPEQACEFAQRSLRRQIHRPYAWELLARLQPERGWDKLLFGVLPHWPTLLIARPVFIATP
jgi:tetratricopeptide (TPR) repeat protein